MVERVQGGDDHGAGCADLVDSEDRFTGGGGDHCFGAFGWVEDSVVVPGGVGDVEMVEQAVVGFGGDDGWRLVGIEPPPVVGWSVFPVDAW